MMVVGTRVDVMGIANVRGCFMRTRFFASIIVACVMLTAPVAAPAETFTLENFTDSSALGTGTLTGSFDYASGVFSDIDVSAATGPDAGDVFTINGTSSPNTLVFNDTGMNVLIIVLASDLPLAGGADAVNGGFANVIPTDTLLFSIGQGASVDAPVSATPLPATLPLFAGGLGFVGYLTRRKKARRH